MPGGERAWRRVPRLAAWAYDQLIGRFVLRGFYRLVVEQVVGHLRGGRILDVGTGPGRVPAEMAQKASALTVVGVDISPAMARRAATNARSAGVAGRVSFVAASADRLPFADGSFDLAIATSSLYLWDEPAVALAELHRVLAAGGEAWLYDTDRDIGPAELDLALRPHLSGVAALIRGPIRWALSHRLAAGYNAAELAAMAAASPFGKAFDIEPIDPDRVAGFIVLKLCR